MKTEKFQYESELSGDGYYASTRTIVGRLTPLRFKVLNDAVRRFNYNNEAPYGKSPNGYAYRCGCEHDCCGCLIGESASVEFKSVADNLVQANFTHTKSINI
jgi:hypothetical protein